MYKINELSSLFDVSTNTIRRYEDYGYISPSRDDENNYRHYSEEDIDKLVYISKSRGFGFSHTDISDMTKASIRYSMNNGTWGLKVNGSVFEYFKRILVILDILQLFNDLPLCGGKGASLPAPYD